MTARRLGTPLVFALMLGARGALAQASGPDVATAQALFDDGKRLMDAGEFAQACPKLVESQRLDPGGGTLILIGLCHEGEGKTATAWADFGVALGQARKDKRADREAAALEHIRKLEPTLSRVRVVVAPASKGVEVLHNGVAVHAAQWGTALPIDPGEHVYEARAAGKKPWSKKVTVEATGASLTIEVPALEPDAAAAPAPAPVAPAPSEPPPVPPGDDAPSSRLPWIALAGGVGVVAAGVGVGFGLSASSKWKDAERACPGGVCPNAADTELGKKAGSNADLSTVFFAIGGVGLATAAVLWLTAPSGKDPARSGLRIAPMIGRGGGGLTLRGSL